MLNPCSGCPAHCCKNYLITVTSFDVFKLSKRLDKMPDEFAGFYPAKILSYDWDTVLHFYDETKLPDYALLALKSRPCIFLENNKCSIHDFSPAVCKRYPRDLGGKLNTRHCSLFSKLLFLVGGRNPDGLQSEYGNYKKIVKSWNTKKGRKDDCMKFLMEESAKQCQFK